MAEPWIVLVGGRVVLARFLVGMVEFGEVVHAFEKYPVTSICNGRAIDPILRQIDLPDRVVGVVDPEGIVPLPGRPGDETPRWDPDDVSRNRRLRTSARSVNRNVFVFQTAKFIRIGRTEDADQGPLG